MVSKVFELGKLKYYQYSVVLSEYNGKILLSRHKERDTWETQGGHIEDGETPLESAERELFEESGAEEFEITPLCDYWAGYPEKKHGANGMVFTAKITKLGKMPDSEMAEVQTFDRLPENLTYPAITPVLFAKLNIGKKVTVTVDRPLGSVHPKHRDITYPINYGYIRGIIGGDGEEQDAYILGIDKPVKEFTGIVKAVIHRFDDCEQKWIVCPENFEMTEEEIKRRIDFQEQYFETTVIM